MVQRSIRNARRQAGRRGLQTVEQQRSGGRQSSRSQRGQQFCTLSRCGGNLDLLVNRLRGEAGRRFDNDRVQDGDAPLPRQEVQQAVQAAAALVQVQEVGWVSLQQFHHGGVEAGQGTRRAAHA